LAALSAGYQRSREWRLRWLSRYDHHGLCGPEENNVDDELVRKRATKAITEVTVIRPPTLAAELDYAVDMRHRTE
jgi:hypothetical protein